jgi:hypothetical protein
MNLPLSQVLERMLAILYHEKKERIVLISNYTQTLDIFQVLQIKIWPGILQLLRCRF